MTKKTLAVEVGLVVRAHRLAAGLSQDRFADDIGMHRAYYAAIERGEKNVTLPTLDRVSRGLGLKMWEVLRELNES